MPLAAIALALLHVAAAQAQEATLDAPILLKTTPQLTENLPRDQRGTFPSFVTGDRLSSRPDLETSVEGNAMLRRGDTVITADRVDYDQTNDLAKARGNVRINQAGNVYEGPELELKLETFEGFFNNARYRFLATGGHGEAERIDFIDESRSVARQASYTTCRREDWPGWVPAWVLSATSIQTDTDEGVGVAENAQLRFMGLSSPAFPSISFPLDNSRKSGFLPPTLGINNINGIEVIQPYYWNIAPNRDATLVPTLMSKRGVNIGGDFRYLENSYFGEVRADYMPTDTLRGRERWGIWAQHRQNFDAARLGLDSLSASLDINRVSDNDYWRDFSRTPSLATRLLANNANLNWSKGDFSGQVRTLAYQTLQYSLAPITPPYDRLPQITGNYNKYDWNGFDVMAGVDFTRFRADPTLAPSLNGKVQPNGERAFSLLQVSRSWLTPGSFLVPKLQLHAAAYQFDQPLAGGATSASRAVPTLSLDGGLVFERDATFFGRAFRQTLEPRAFYVYTPYRDQNKLPVYDSASNDFNFATIYTENAFSGNDRISDSNLLTTGATTRLIDADTGAEAARFGLAQRFRFSDQKVTLPGGAPVTDRLSDVLVGAQINWTPKWSVDTTVQYNPDTQRSVRNTVGARYSPGPFRTVSASYRYQDDSVTGAANGGKSVDIGWQWPLNDLWGDKGRDLGPGRGQGGNRWYLVGRLNYSLRDSRLTDALAGVEYDGCCYIARVVMEQISTGQISATKRILFQLEFVGFSSVGSSPVQALRQNVPRYQNLRSPAEAPSRFTNYD